MSSPVVTAFDLCGVQVPVGRILPTKEIVSDEKKNATFRRIKASIHELGLIEPLIIYPQGSAKASTYSLLDGHIRFEALKQLGYKEVPCLISTEDDAYTYNHKVNVVPPIQEHFMIMKAIENGVSEEKIAATLSVNVSSIRHKRDLLNGICPEAVELLKTKPTGEHTMRELRKAKPIRQIEMAELMIRAHNFSSSYAKCLVAATPEEHLAEPSKPKAPKGISSDDVADMEKEMEMLEQNFAALESTHGQNVFHLMLATTYLKKLFDNQTITRFLLRHHPDVMAELQKIIALPNLDGTV